MSDNRAPALVCANGHLLTGDAKEDRENVHKFCPKCGAKAIEACPNCDGIIPGDHYYEDWHGQLQQGEQIRAAPRFCGQCSAPFPWTESALEAARLLIEESELDAADMTALTESLPELVRDTSKTQAATVRWVRILKDAGMATKDALRDVLVNVISEAVKKGIWG